MKKISDIFKDKTRTYSFEFFPPKTPDSIEKLYETVDILKNLSPDFLSVTYGAGGSTRELTMNIVDELQNRFGVPVMHHLTCVHNSKTELKSIIEKMKKKNIRNILALRGDPPQDIKDYKPPLDEFKYAYQLCELIRSYGDFFSIGVAGFPEGHINTPDKETDSKYLKMKIDAGTEFVITQLFFDNRDYFEYLERTKKLGVTVRIIPGILPITNYKSLLKFCERCGATIPKQVHNIFEPLADNEEETYKRGVEFTVKQCNDLLENGASGLHFYSLNKVNPVYEILTKIKR